VLLAREIEGIVLRYGYFYGPGTAYGADGTFTEDVSHRRVPIVGGGTGICSFVHVDDAAAATLLAIERGPGGVYNVVDDDPAPVSEWLPEFARIVGARAPRRVPELLGRLAAGAYGVYFMTRQRGASNAKVKAELGWSPAHRSWREGFVGELTRP
jgi:nucleoside-diphosphate-sugar epimerase